MLRYVLIGINNIVQKYTRIIAKYFNYVNVITSRLKSTCVCKSTMFFKIDVFKIFANFIEKHLCWTLFLIKLQALRTAGLLKGDSNIGVFQ